jgi:hypothetical protein
LGAQIYSLILKLSRKYNSKRSTKFNPEQDASKKKIVSAEKMLYYFFGIIGYLALLTLE